MRFGALLSLAGLTAASTHGGLGLWFDAFDEDGDGMWNTQEVAHLVGILGSKDENYRPTSEAMAARDTSHARDFIRSLGGDTELSRAAFLHLTSVGDQAVPNQVRVTPASEGTMAVTWVQDTEAASTPCVRWCEAISDNCTDAEAVTWEYTVDSRWWNPDGSGYSTFHGALLPAAVGATYRYAVGNSSEACASPTTWYTVTTPGDNTMATKVAVLGDQGSVQLFGFKIADLMKAELPSWKPDAVFVMGDVAYAGIATNFKLLNITSDDEFEPFWNTYGVMMSPLTSAFASITSHGNHDNFYDSAAYKARWTSGPDRLTSLPPNMQAPTWYGIDVGNIHFTVLDSEVSSQPGSEQRAFAEKDLAQASKAAADGTGPTWLVLVNHRPFVSSDASGINAHSPSSPLIQSLQPLCVQYKVDLTLTGHQHAYERVHPQLNGTVVATSSTAENIYYQTPFQAPVQVMVGTGGAIQEDTWTIPAPAWSAFRTSNVPSAYGYGQLTAFNDSHLYFEFRSVKPNTTHPSDHFWIRR